MGDKEENFHIDEKVAGHEKRAKKERETLGEGKEGREVQKGPEAMK
jgi:hypothetical protein